MKLFRFITMLLLLLLLAGFDNATARVEVNKDESVEITLEALVNDLIYSLAGPVLEENVANTEYEVTTREEEGSTFVQISRDFPSFRNLPAGGNFPGDTSFSREENNYFFFTVYNVRGEVNLQEELNNVIPETIDNPLVNTFIGQVTDQINLTLEVVLPGGVFTDSNADETEGNTFIWNITAAEDTVIELEIIAPHIGRIIVGTILIAAAILGSFVLLRRRGKKSE